MVYLMPIKEKYVTFEPSSIETIDSALYDWVNNSLNLYTSTNRGWEKVPTIWLGTERAYQVKNNKELRDDEDRLILPIITVSRDSIVKDMSFRGSFWSNFPERNDYGGGTITISRRIEQEKTRNIVNAALAREAGNGANIEGRAIVPTEASVLDNINPVIESVTIPAPVYITVMYDINLKTEYQQQMNDLTQPFITKIGQINSFFISKDGHRYEAFVEQDFAETKNIKDLGEDERLFETNVKIKVLGFLIGEGMNRERPKATIRQNRVRVRVSRERVSLGDKIIFDGLAEGEKDYIE